MIAARKGASRCSLLLALGLLFAGGSLAHGWFFPEWKSGIIWPEPAVIDPGTSDSAPSDATVLFDGTDLSQFKGGEKWEIRDGYAVSKGGGLRSKESFGTCQLHVEYASPPEVKGRGQGRGNSGVYLIGPLRGADSGQLRQPDLLRRPVRRDLQTVAADGQRVPQTRRVADARHFVHRPQV